MGKLVYRQNEFIVIEDDYKPGQHIIINTKGQYHNHGHVKYLGTCKKLIYWMERNIVPDSDYLRECALRLSLDKKYKKKIRHKIEKDNQKPKFVRVNKGAVNTYR